MEFAGKWHIFEMEVWDEDYFNMDVQAYIEIKRDNLGTFQFGLVEGEFRIHLGDDSTFSAKRAE